MIRCYVVIIRQSDGTLNSAKLKSVKNKTPWARQKTVSLDFLEKYARQGRQEYFKIP